MKLFIKFGLFAALAMLQVGCLATNLRPQAQVDREYAAELRASRTAGMNGGMMGMGGVGMGGMMGGGIPQGMAMMDRPIPGCPGDLLVEFVNQTDAFHQLFVDGQELSMIGETAYESLPPRQTVFVCLEEPGRHSVSSVVYRLRYGQWVQIGSIDTQLFAAPIQFSAIGHHMVYLTNQQIRTNQ